MSAVSIWQDSKRSQHFWTKYSKHDTFRNSSTLPTWLMLKPLRPLKITCTKSSFEGPPNVPAEFALWPTSTSLTTPQSSGRYTRCLCTKNLVPSGKLTVCYWKWHIEIVDLPIASHSMVIFHSVFSLYQTVPSVEKTSFRYGWYSGTDQKIHRAHHQSHDDWWYPWVTGVMPKTSTIKLSNIEVWS